MSLGNSWTSLQVGNTRNAIKITNKRDGTVRHEKSGKSSANIG